MSKERRRGIRTEQLRMREMNVAVVAGGGTGPFTMLGFDRFGVTGDHTGVGTYVLSFNSAFGRDDIMGFITVLGNISGSGSVVTVSRSSINISTFDAAGAPSDRDFMIRILGSEFNYDI